MKYVGAEPVSRLAMAVKPRYHFAGKHHRFYERTPYRLGMCVMNTSPCAPVDVCFSCFSGTIKCYRKDSNT